MMLRNGVFDENSCDFFGSYVHYFYLYIVIIEVITERLEDMAASITRLIQRLTNVICWVWLL